MSNGIELRAAERLSKLIDHVRDLSKKNFDPVKDAVFWDCTNSRVRAPMVQCRSEVGTGKTTAMLSYALQLCKEGSFSRIFCVAPFTSIISQTVGVYRRAVVLPDEESFASQVVAENHHQVQYADKRDKRYAADWLAPIVCTTSAQFFDTMGGSDLRRLIKFQQVVGSIIMIDESHANLSPRHWPAVLDWLHQLTGLGCRVIFASGSMVEPWNSERILRMKLSRLRHRLPYHRLEVPSIVSPEVADQTLRREKTRVPITFDPDPEKQFETADELCDVVESYVGSKIVVCNTIQNAAIVANALRRRRGADYVSHLSTALTPADRENTLEHVRKRLIDAKFDDWALVATSCVEAGVDISFKWGFRELAPLSSVLQLAGRVSRNNDFKGECGLRIFTLKTGNVFSSNPSLYAGISAFRKLDLQCRKTGVVLGPEHAAKAFDMELDDSLMMMSETLSVENHLKKDGTLDLKSSGDAFKVIDSEKGAILVNEHLLNATASYWEFGRNSVQLYENKIEKYEEQGLIEPSSRFEGLSVWLGAYDSFLGYCAEFAKDW